MLKVQMGNGDNQIGKRGNKLDKVQGCNIVF